MKQTSIAPVALLLVTICSGIDARAGTSLDLTGATQTLSLTLPGVHPFRTGTVPWPPVAKPFTSSRFILNASLFSGLRASYSPRANPTWSPAWASLSHELEAYPNADAMTDLDIQPFGISNDIFLITASEMGAAAKATLPSDMKRTYLSGALNTYPFSQTYGYFEFVAQVPKGRGLWPAFWLLSVDDQWPPEIDAPEVLGNDTTTAYFSLHTGDAAWVAKQPDGYNGSAVTTAVKAGADLSLAFHHYGVDWGPTKIMFYLDNKQVGQRTTPSDMHKPFYLIANLAVGGVGSWPGPPDAQTVFPATLRVKSIKVWQRPAYAAVAAAGH